MNETILLMFRLVATAANLMITYEAIHLSEAYWVYYISNWSIVISSIVQVLLLYSHFKEFDPYYDNFVKAIF